MYYLLDNSMKNTFFIGLLLGLEEITSTQHTAQLKCTIHGKYYHHQNNNDHLKPIKVSKTQSEWSSLSIYLKPDISVFIFCLRTCLSLTNGHQQNPLPSKKLCLPLAIAILTGVKRTIHSIKYTKHTIIHDTYIY